MQAHPRSNNPQGTGWPDWQQRAVAGLHQALRPLLGLLAQLSSSVDGIDGAKPGGHQRRSIVITVRRLDTRSGPRSHGPWFVRQPRALTLIPIRTATSQPTPRGSAATCTSSRCASIQRSSAGRDHCSIRLARALALYLEDEAAMRTYPCNSPEAAARLVALVLIADGHVCRSEMDALAHLEVARELGLQPHAMAGIVQTRCEDLLLGAYASGSLPANVDDVALASLMAEVTDPLLRERVFRLALAIANADCHLAEGEVLVIEAARRHWADMDVRATLNKSLTSRASTGRAVCGVANPRHSPSYGCGLRLATHPSRRRPPPRGLIQSALRNSPSRQQPG